MSCNEMTRCTLGKSAISNRILASTQFVKIELWGWCPSWWKYSNWNLSKSPITKNSNLNLSRHSCRKTKWWIIGSSGVYGKSVKFNHLFLILKVMTRSPVSKKAWATTKSWKEIKVQIRTFWGWSLSINWFNRTRCQNWDQIIKKWTRFKLWATRSIAQRRLKKAYRWSYLLKVDLNEVC